MTAAQITTVVRNMPADKRATVTPRTFLTWPAVRAEYPAWAVIEAAIEAGR